MTSISGNGDVSGGTTIITFNSTSGVVYSQSAGFQPLVGNGGQVRGLSFDGSVRTGNSNALGVYRWTQATGAQSLGIGGSAQDVSGDGNTIVGSFTGGQVWTQANGVTSIGNTSSVTAQAASHDGSAITGFDSAAGHAYRWTSQTGRVNLFAGFASSISADGSTVVGQTNSNLAVRWQQGSGVLDLGNLGLGGSHSALDASGDGSTVVGWSGRQAFIWDALNGIRNLNDVLPDDYGIDLTGFELLSAEAISDDGLVMAGVAKRTDNNRAVGWYLDLRSTVVAVPAPQSVLVFGIAIVGLYGVRRRTRTST